jgi:hypothetical protein
MGELLDGRDTQPRFVDVCLAVTLRREQQRVALRLEQRLVVVSVTIGQVAGLAQRWRRCVQVERYEPDVR